MIQQEQKDIKFKVWIPYSKIMMQPKSIHTIQHEQISGMTVGQFESWVYLQYTLMKDMDGNEIYDGDILRHHLTYENSDIIPIVKVIREEGQFKFKSLNSPYDPPLNWISSGYRVIGNIYQPPIEILEKNNCELVYKK